MTLLHARLSRDLLFSPYTAPPAINKGPSNPTAHQPGPEGGQGAVGRRQGEGSTGCSGGRGGLLQEQWLRATSLPRQGWGLCSV